MVVLTGGRDGGGSLAQIRWWTGTSGACGRQNGIGVMRGVCLDLAGRARQGCEAKGSAQWCWEPGQWKMGKSGVGVVHAKGGRERG
jgi:hypothetical protein